MTATVMEDPVMTVDGCVYERAYIERWMRQRQQEKLRVTSPATNKELPSLRLVSLTALRKAIEAYLAHRPEIRDAHLASRSFEEVAQMLYGDLLEKEAVHANAEDELSLLKDSNEVLLRGVQEGERWNARLKFELEQARLQAQAFGEALREERANNEVLRARLQALECGTSMHRDGDEVHYEEHIDDTNLEKIADRTPCISRGEGVPACGEKVAACLENSIAELSSPSAAHSRSLVAAGSCSIAKDEPSLVKGTCKGASHLSSRNLRGLLISAFLLLILVILIRDVDREVVVDIAPQCKLMMCNTSVPATEAFNVTLPSTATLPLESRELSHEDMQKKIFLNQVGRLRMGSTEEKTHAALVLGIAAATSVENQAAIVRAGAVAPLVELLQVDAAEARGQATVALRTLAMDNSHSKAAITEAGAIPLLMKLVRDDNLEVQEVAAAALQVLTDASDQAEAIDSLAALLEDETPGVREEAAEALMLLALNSDQQGDPAITMFPRDTFVRLQDTPKHNL